MTATPTVKIDGLAAGYSPGGYAAAINSRLSVPSYVSIEPNMVGNASGGTGYYSITAEQDLGASGQIKVWSVVIQDNFIAAGSWGGYTGMEMMWMPVAWPLGATGQVINFTGPYPQTIDVMGTYTLNPTIHIFNNLKVVTFVQLGSGTREVLNADYMDLPDTATGVYGDEATQTGESAQLFVGPNPCHGQFTVSSVLPQGQTGTVSVYDISGRVVQSFPAGGTSSAVVEETGLYFVRMTTSTGLVENRQIAVVR